MIIVRSTAGKALRQRVVDLISADTAMPTFSASTAKLSQMLGDPNIEFRRLAGIVETDPTLAAACLRLASSAAYGRGRIDSVAAAMTRIGIREIRRLSAIKGVLDTFRRFRVNLNWNVFMTHALLTARVTEHLCNAYSRKPIVEGTVEHLAGLLHDIGRIFLEHQFPQEFEATVLRSMERGQGMFEIEVDQLGISHAEIGSLMCRKWNLNPDVIFAIRYHHEPRYLSVMNSDSDDSARLLAVCLCAANAMANCYGETFAGAPAFHRSHELLPEWKVLSAMVPYREVEINIEAEIATVGEVVTTLLAA